MPNRDYYLPKRQLVSQDDAAMIEKANIPRSKFIGAWTRKTAFDAGYLVPFMVDEVLPGDHLSYDVTAYVRMATPIFPLFDNQRIDTFWFYVPARILWVNWNRFMGEQPNPGDSIAYTLPKLTSPVGGFAEFSIYDHMGIPIALEASSTIQVNSLPLRAYNRIWNDWFRDQNIQNRVPVRIDDSDDLVADYELKRRNKSHDYFTTALPWAQKFASPATPLTGLAPIQGIGLSNTNTSPSTEPVLETARGSVNYVLNSYIQNSGNIPSDQVMFWEMDANGPAIYADLSQATGMTINNFRQAFMIQSLVERDARGGTRYVELLRSHFGVINPDFRLQRPEYIGGGQSALNITPIAQTAPTEGSVVGQLGGAGTAVGQHRASYAATEHGYILGLINVRTELSYQQGLHKMWTRSTRYDFYWPSLAALGEQAVLRQEIYATGEDALDETVFGYQERWHEYRTRTSEVTGIMNSTRTGTIDSWHLAQEFAAPPTLSDAFIRDEPPMTRVLAAGGSANNQQYLADILIKRTAVRAIPTFGTPALLGRF